MRHQHAIALALDDPAYMSLARVGELKRVSENLPEVPEDVRNQMTASMQTGASVSVGGTQYSSGDALFIKENDRVSLLVIKHVVLEKVSDEVKMIVGVMETEFYYHVNAYKLFPTNRMRFVTLKSMVDYHPLRVYQSNGARHVILRWYVEQQ